LRLSIVRALGPELWSPSPPGIVPAWAALPPVALEEATAAAGAHNRMTFE